jgi:predicted permease
MNDLRLAFRQLLKNPGFTAVAVLTLGLGIGANTAIFSVLDKLLLRTLPVEEPERLVTFAGDESRTWQTQVSYPAYASLRDRCDALLDLIAYNGTSLVLEADGSTERIAGQIGSGNFFSVLRVKMALGRSFLTDEDRTPGSHPVAVISHALWQRRFGADPSALGRNIKLNGHPFTVVGVTPAEFTGIYSGRRTDIYIPMMMLGQVFPLEAHKLTQADNWINLMGRLKPAVSREQAQAAVSVLALQLQQGIPENSRKRIFLHDGRQGNTDRVRNLTRPVTFLAGMAALVLVIACANLAHLLLARATVRQKEIAVRLALGASRARILRQLLTESLLLSIAGGTFGLWLGVWSARVLSSLQPQVEFSAILNWRLIAFTISLSLVTGLIFGLMPAFQTAASNLVLALKDRTAASGQSGRSRGRRQLLVVPQIALALAVLISAGLCLRSLQRLSAIDVGFERSRVLIAPLNLGDANYNEARGREFYSQLLERVIALPGVQSAAWAQISPFSGGRLGTPVRPAEEVEPIEFGYNRIGPKYFQTLGTPLRQGRDFGSGDVAGGQLVAIINETAARRFWPDGEPIGQCLHLRGGPDDWQAFEIIGVVADSKSSKLTEDVRPDMYVAMSQFYSGDMTLHVRTENASTGLAAALRGVVRALDSPLPIEIKTLDERIHGTLTSERMTSWLLTAFGLLALVLAVVGIYGVLAFSVSQRTHEIGLRMALGAQRRDVLGLVLRQGMRFAGVGIALGLGLAFALTRLLRTLLYDISSTDPLTFVVIPLLLAGVALLACWLPARRATKVDPMVALKDE